MEFIIRNSKVSEKGRTLTRRDEKKTNDMPLSEDKRPVSSQTAISGAEEAVGLDVQSRDFETQKKKIIQETMEKALTDAEIVIEEKIMTERTRLENEFNAKLSYLDKQASLLSNAIQEFENNNCLSIANSESQVLRLTMESVYKLTGERSFFNSIITRVVKETIENMDSIDTPKIRYSDSDSKIINEIKEKFEGQCIFIMEAQLSPGACIVESGYSTTDMGLKVHLDQLRDTLLETHRQRFSNES